ncbi:MAG TPA: hypothetical protein VM534_02560 [Thermoanaerobaculia bacterium]|nr:hypothetical protein [Thermoanaerobaculia bacterium]
MPWRRWQFEFPRNRTGSSGSWPSRTRNLFRRSFSDAIETYRRARFLEQANEAFGRLRSDDALWKHEQAERALWSNVEDQTE